VVKAPFDATQAKSSVYQTGVWCPGIVAGPPVKKPGREVNAMVNIADLYQLFGELAGIDVHQSVPRTVDAQSILPYLVNPAQPAIRKTNFTQIGHEPPRQRRDQQSVPIQHYHLLADRSDQRRV